MIIKNCVISQFLSEALLQCHEEAQNAGQRFALEVFVAGRNRLESVGATALSKVFEVCCGIIPIARNKILFV